MMATELIKRLWKSLFVSSVIAYDVILSHFAINYWGFVELNPLYYILGYQLFVSINIFGIIFSPIAEYLWGREEYKSFWLVVFGMALFRLIIVTKFFVLSFLFPVPVG